MCHAFRSRRVSGENSKLFCIKIVGGADAKKGSNRGPPGGVNGSFIWFEVFVTFPDVLSNVAPCFAVLYVSVVVALVAICIF